MKNTSPKQIMLCVILLGGLLLIGVYFLVYKSYIDKAEDIERTNVALNKRVAELKEYYDNMDMYNTEIELMQTEIRNVLAQFPPDVREEDMIVLALNTIKTADVEYTNLNFGDREALRSIPAETVQAAGMEELNLDLVFVERKSAYVNNTVYQSLKDCINTINNSNNRLAITNITYSRDEETGELSGTIQVSFYSVLGTGREYEPQNLGSYTSGLSELFGTLVPQED
ncbi:MAG: hypothetical protein J1E65_03230 [Lachnospiraceae bacterium]|nr:hypothetical protein [Lachnospiraceae bacterium]